MKPIFTFVLLSLSVVLLGSCKSHKKKVLVYANSTIGTDVEETHLTVKAGTSHVEKELIFTSGDPVELDVTGPSGNQKFEVKEDGEYLLNLKADTVVGSMQHIGENAATEVTQVQLKAHLDSLNKLIMNQNITTAGKNYFVAPGQMVKVTTFPEAKIWGPFTTIPGSFDAGSVPEVYKFYNVSEVREIIGKLTKMSKYQGQEEQEAADKKK